LARHVGVLLIAVEASIPAFPHSLDGGEKKIDLSREQAVFLNAIMPQDWRIIEGSCNRFGFRGRFLRFYFSKVIGFLRSVAFLGLPSG
jgi:hypothetical protein